MYIAVDTGRLCVVLRGNTLHNKWLNVWPARQPPPALLINNLIPHQIVTSHPPGRNTPTGQSYKNKREIHKQRKTSANSSRLIFSSPVSHLILHFINNKSAQRWLAVTAFGPSGQHASVFIDMLVSSHDTRAKQKVRKITALVLSTNSDTRITIQSLVCLLSVPIIHHVASSAKGSP